MGINMEVKAVIGVKLKELPKTILEEDYNTIKDTIGLEIYEDHYVGNWVIVGEEVHSSQDNRYDQQDFVWEINCNSKTNNEIYNKLRLIGINVQPKLICFTYYT